MIALGIDGGLAALGWALVRIEGAREVPIEAGLVETERSTAKLRVLDGDDTARRVRELALALDPLVARAGLVCVERFSPPRNAGAAAKAGMGYAVALALTAVRGLPLLHESPQRVKLATARDKSASKSDVQLALVRRYGALSDVIGHVAPSKREHPCDALAVVVACLDSELVRLARRRAA
jgi:Holliday junction resolvasome RuvABC endonuclease subunit